MKDNFYKNILDNLYDGVYFVDRERQITYWNKAAEEITGYSSEFIEGKFCFNNYLDHIDANGKHLCLEGCPLHATIQDGEKREAAVYLKNKDGDRVPVVVKTMPMYEDGKIIGAIEIFNDNYELFTTLLRLDKFKDMAFTDQLTGLPNRHYIDEFLSNSKVLRKLRTSILFLDIDNFKNLNDTYGHPHGDKVLVEIGKVLKENLKKTDEVFRYGGEEFMLMVFDNDFENVIGVAERIREMVEKAEIYHGETKTPVTVSIGVTMQREDEILDDCIERADHLMYQSKVSGKNKITSEM